jgi:hypothetical protein
MVDVPIVPDFVSLVELTEPVLVLVQSFEELVLHFEFRQVSVVLQHKLLFVLC